MYTTAETLSANIDNDEFLNPIALEMAASASFDILGTSISTLSSGLIPNIVEIYLSIGKNVIERGTKIILDKETRDSIYYFMLDFVNDSHMFNGLESIRNGDYLSANITISELDKLYNSCDKADRYKFEIALKEYSLWRFDFEIVQLCGGKENYDLMVEFIQVIEEEQPDFFDALKIGLNNFTEDVDNWKKERYDDWQVGWKHILRNRNNDFSDTMKIFINTSSDAFSSITSDFDTASTVTYDPLILDLNGNGFEINSKENGVYFDLNNDGFAEKINWTSSDAILAIDKNGNGKIDDGSEAFGDYHLLADGTRAKDGFEALAQYDTNGDGIIDENDEIFHNLMLWVDSNNNGISDEGELKSLSAMGIKAISLNYESVNQATDSEAVIGNIATFIYEDGTTGNVGEMWVSSDLYDSIETLSVQISDSVNGLPNVRSFGKVHSLHTAIALDETGTLQNLVENFTSETNHENRFVIVKEILEFICNASDINPNSRGSHIDAKKLAVIEALMGKSFVGAGKSKNPNPNAAAILNETFDKIVDVYYFAMIGSEVFQHFNFLQKVTDENGNTLYNTYYFNRYMLYILKHEMINESTFTDICAYLNYFSMTQCGNHNLYLEFRNFIDTYANEYLDLIDKSAHDAIRGTNDSDKITATNGNDLIFAAKGDDEIYAGSGNDEIFGDSGNDILYGEAGNDTLDGGTGNDMLYGGSGDDTYIFGRGYGHDTIDEQNKNSKNDRVLFKDGITADDILLSRDGNDMILSIRDTDDSLRIVNQYGDSYYWIEKFEFADGTVITADDYFKQSLEINGSGVIKDFDNGYGTRNTTLIGSDEDDEIYGYSGNDTLDGGTGNDMLYGGSGDDTYIFGRGYGHDTIDEQNKNSKNDRVLFKDGITADDILLSRDGNDMILSIRDTDDSLRIVNQYGNSYYRIETFELMDGTIAEINLQTLEFNILVKGTPINENTTEEQLIQSNADILSTLYSDDSPTSELLTESNDTVISDISDSVTVADETNEIADQTDLQVMILTENMSAFANEDNISDGINVLDPANGTAVMDQMLVGSQIQ